MALGYGSYVSMDWVNVKSDFQYLAEACTHEETQKTKTGLKLVLPNNMSAIFYQSTPSLCSVLIKK